MAGVKWGANTGTLLRYVNGCIRPTAENGIQALTTLQIHHQQVRSLDTALPRALGIALGVAQRTITMTLYFETEFTPIWL